MGKKIGSSATALHRYSPGHPNAPRPARRVIPLSPWRPVHRYASIKAARRVECESYLERDYCYLLDIDPLVLDFASQPETFIYMDGEMERRYTPDFLVTYADHCEMIEVKPANLLKTKPTNWAAIGQAILRHGFQFRIITDQDIRREPHLTNAKLLARYRRPDLNSGDAHRVRAALYEHRPKTLGQLANLARLRDDWCILLYGMVLAGEFKVDLNVPLGSATPIFGCGR